MNKPEPRTNFYAPGLNMDRVYFYVEELAKNCSFEEICKIFREISYDQVRYDNDRDCAFLYKSGEYSKLAREQANRFHNQVRTICDLYAQCISDRREFNEDYLKNYAFAGPYLLEIGRLEERIKELEERIEELEGEDD